MKTRDMKRESEREFMWRGKMECIRGMRKREREDGCILLEG